MALTIGIICAFIAMFAWGFGDYLIQRSTRSIGDWETIFIISLVGTLVLAPFSASKVGVLFINKGQDIILLLIASVVLFVAALLEFEALRRGKLSVVEPIWSSEIIASAVLAFFLLGERLSFIQCAVIVMLIIGLFLVSIRSATSVRRLLVEKASLLALGSAIVMGGANFLFGISSRATDPLVTNFFTSLFLVVCSGIYLLAKGKMRTLWTDIARAPGRLLTMSVLDNGAWIAFAFAMTLAPIGIAVALSESYIIIAVLLGLLSNKERLHRHQKIGLVIAIVFAIVLALITI